MENKISKAPSFAHSESALDEFLAAWEAGTLRKDEWTHAAHVAIAACYAFDLNPQEALSRTRCGIIHFNESVGTANTDSSGYHETLTRLWSGIIGDFVRSASCPSRFAAVLAAVKRFGEDRSRHRLYYTFDVVGDVNARRHWVPPDRSPL